MITRRRPLSDVILRIPLEYQLSGKDDAGKRPDADYRLVVRHPPNGERVLHAQIRYQKRLVESRHGNTPCRGLETEG